MKVHTTVDGRQHLLFVVALKVDRTLKMIKQLMSIKRINGETETEVKRERNRERGTCFKTTQ